MRFEPLNLITNNEAEVRIRGSGVFQNLPTENGQSGQSLGLSARVVAVQDDDAFTNAGIFELLEGAEFRTRGDWVNTGNLMIDTTSSLVVNGELALGPGSDVSVSGQLSSDTIGIDEQGLLHSGGSITSDLTNRGTFGPVAVTFVNDTPTDREVALAELFGDFTQTNTGVLDIDIGGLLPGEEYDQITVSGTAMLGGQIELELVDLLDPESNLSLFQPSVGDLFDVLIAESIVDDAYKLTMLNTLSRGRTFQDQIVDLPLGGQALRVITIPEPSDLLLVIVGSLILSKRRRYTN